MKLGGCVAVLGGLLVGGIAWAETVLESPPLSSEEALTSIVVPKGYTLELVAAEPMVKDPVAFDWDEAGRLWVVEMADYPLGMDNKGKAGGRVRLLSDTNGDGRYDQSSLIADGLNYPNGILTWRDGAIVTAAPDILFLRDGNGDGVMEKEVLLTGLSEGNQQLRANGLRWGLDNWVYVAAGGHHGGYPANTKVRSTRNGNKVVAVGSRDFRFKPDTGEVEPQSGPSQFGRNRDAWGNWFGTQNSRPLWHYVLPDHYLRRNPHLAVGDARVQLPGTLNPPVYPASKSQKRFHSFQHKNHYTSACGSMIYRDHYLFGAEDRSGFACEPFHNLAQRLQLSNKGATFAATRPGAPNEPDFFASSDRWCRPVMVRTGPDGCLWVADMYRYMIEHPQWLPDKGKNELLPFYRHGDDRGRIYRVRRTAEKPGQQVDFRSLGDEELLKFISVPNGWLRDKAQQISLWRGKTKPALVRNMIENMGPYAALHGLAILDGLGELTPEDVVTGLNHDHPGVRIHALKLSESRATPAVMTVALKSASNEDAKVRQQLAFSIGAYSATKETGAALATLLGRPDVDPYVVTAAFSSILPHLRETVGALQRTKRDLPDGARQQLLEIMLRAGRTKELIFFLHRAFERTTQSFAWDRMSECLELIDLMANSGTPLASVLKEAEKGDHALGKELIDLHQQLAVRSRDAIKGKAGFQARISGALFLTRRSKDRAAGLQAAAGLIDPTGHPGELRTVVVGLAQTNDAMVAGALLSFWKSYSPEGKRLVATALLSRRDWCRELLDGVEKGTIARTEIEPAQVLRLRNHPDKKLKERADKLLALKSNAERAEVIASFRPALKLKGDLKRGEALFTTSCVSCHKRGKVGQEIGPDLKTVREHPTEKLLINILDPNLDIQPGYHAYNCRLKSGEELFGLLASENAVGIVIKQIDGSTRTVLRSDIATLKSVNQSLMPEGLEANWSPQDLADILAFVKGG